MSDYPAGWYDDPKTEGQERYWDGTGWTHDVREAFAPGWYADPDRFGSERYWDGAAWTEDRRFATRLDDSFLTPSGFRGKQRRMVITGELLALGDDSIKWADVTGFDAVSNLSQNRTVALYSVTATGAGQRLKMEIVPEGPDDQRTADAFMTILDQAHRMLVPPILRDLYARSDAGEPVEYQKVTMSSQGFAKKGGKDPVPWSEYGGWKQQGALFMIDKMKGDKAKRSVSVNTSQLERWVLVALLDDFSRRFAGMPPAGS